MMTLFRCKSLFIASQTPTNWSGTVVRVGDLNAEDLGSDLRPGLLNELLLLLPV